MTEPADAGKNLENPETMAETDPQSEALSCRFIGGQRFLVSNRETKGLYIVNLENIDYPNGQGPESGKTCTCADAKFNIEADSEACKHVHYVIRNTQFGDDLDATLLTQAYHQMQHEMEVVQRKLTGLNAQQAAASGGETQSSSDDSEDAGKVSEADPTDEQEALMDKVNDWILQASEFAGFDPEIVDLSWAETGAKQGVQIGTNPFAAGYYDTSNKEWIDKDAFDAEKEKLKEKVLKPTDEVQYYGEPDYANFIPESDIESVVS